MFGPAGLDTQPTPALRTTNPDTLAQIFGVSLFAIAVVRSAWMSDDAYITLRTIDNFVHGYGLRWNVVERVQTFSHPLWMMLLTIPYYFTREAYLTTLAVSIVVSLVAVSLLVRRIASSLETAAIGVAVLTFSKAYVEYSTSGLENPLSFLLLALFVWLWFRDRTQGTIRGLWLIAGLLMLNRLDLAVLVLPALAVLTVRTGWQATIRHALVSLSPLIAWELFSIVYYGFPLPNTAYAKLQTGIPLRELIAQGLLYLLDLVTHDPVTALALAVCTLASLSAARRTTWPLAAGIGLYLCYILRIGGDFMAGRFLAAPLLVAVAMFARQDWRLSAPLTGGAVAAVAFLGCFATLRPPILTTPHQFDVEPRDVYGVGGTDDERAIYSRYTALVRESREVPLPFDALIVESRKSAGVPQVKVMGGIGAAGYFAGPATHIIDPVGLGDPLTARLPANNEKWRIGHFERKLPAGYEETIRTGQNRIQDPATAHFYDQLTRITRGPIWSQRRWRAIWNVNVYGFRAP
jgi:arabinofuranosyltransferase